MKLYDFGNAIVSRLGITDERVTMRLKSVAIGVLAALLSLAPGWAQVGEYQMGPDGKPVMVSPGPELTGKQDRPAPLSDILAIFSFTVALVSLGFTLYLQRRTERKGAMLFAVATVIVLGILYFFLR